MKVLLFCPTHRLEPETLDAIMRMDPAGHQVHVVFTRHNPAKIGHYNILYNYRQGRELALAGGYDAMLTIESDMIPPVDTLRRLTRVEADMALGLYVHRHNPNLERSECNPMVYPLDDDPRSMIWLSWDPEQWRAAWGNIVRVSGGGLGCALTHRHVLEAIQFRLVTFGGKWIPADCDAYFCADVVGKGMTIKIDMSCICGHKRPDGVVLWPALDGIKTKPGDPSRLYHMESINYGSTSSRFV